MKKIILITVAIIATIGSILLYNYSDSPPLPGKWQHVGPGEYIKNGYVRILPPPVMMKYMSCATGDTVEWSRVSDMAWKEGTYEYEYKVGADGDTCIQVIQIKLKKSNEVQKLHGLDCWPKDAIEIDKDARLVK
tara:strand:- start:613 stop:1014 length:402 start_codon:yes stop_codon:yes gene_type:complete